MPQQSRRYLVWAVITVALALLLTSLPPIQAQSDVRYFPETQHTLRGAFRVFWEANGGVPIFGFPITEEFTGPNGRIMQWFERARFELAVGGPQPVVELGNLGIEFTQGRIFPKAPPIPNTPDRRYIPQTQHIIQYGFKEIWERWGAERIFGFPISNEIDEQLESGRWHTVQYFEKARFEYWPEFPPGNRVVISTLGRRLAPPELQAPVPPPGQPTPAPPAPTPLPTPSVPPSVNAQVTPESGPPGTTFRFTAQGFLPGERVGIWLTAPNQATFGAPFQITADNQGAIGGDQLSITADESFAEGIWSFNARGVRSGREAIGYFRITRIAPGDPNRLARAIHDELERQGNIFTAPVAGPPGTPFFVFAGGFQPDEPIDAWVAAPGGRSISLSRVSAKNGSVEVEIATGDWSEGVYTAMIRGRRSGVQASAAFSLTREFVAGPGTPRPPNRGGNAIPSEARPGEDVQIQGEGFRPGESVESWMTNPRGIYVLSPMNFPTDDQGRLGFGGYKLLVSPEGSPGVYGVHLRGIASRVQVDVYFSVIGSARATPDRTWLVNALRLAADRNFGR